MMGKIQYGYRSLRLILLCEPEPSVLCQPPGTNRDVGEMGKEEKGRESLTQRQKEQTQEQIKISG